MPALRSNRAASVPVTIGLLVGLATLLGGAACTDGTTPDCTDAQCLVVLEVPETGAGGGDAGDAGDDATIDSSTGVDANAAARAADSASGDGPTE
jgi:hypothetical protein